MREAFTNEECLIFGEGPEVRMTSYSHANQFNYLFNDKHRAKLELTFPFTD